MNLRLSNDREFYRRLLQLTVPIAFQSLMLASVAGTFFLNWPVLVVYACTCLDEVGKIPWVLYHYRKYKWVRDLTRELPAEN